MADSPLNFLVFVADQLRADHLGCYGNPEVATPCVDRLARDGIRFSEAYVANPMCMPNRASLFTGRWPKAHGLRENGITLSPAEPVLPDLLRQAGYQTAAFGKIHLAPFGFGHNRLYPPLPHELYEDRDYWEQGGDLPCPYYGFDRAYFVGGHGPYAFGQYKRDLDRQRPGAYAQLQVAAALAPPTGAVESWKAAIPEALHYNTAIADETIAYLRAARRDRPFYVWCSFPDPHHPYSPPRPYCDLYDPDQISFRPARRSGELDDLPPFFRECYEGKRIVDWTYDLRQVTDEHLREILAHTYGMVAMVDHNVGRVMGVLEETGLLDHTVVIFLSDHADLMGDHWLIQKGPFLFRGLLRVPFIWRLPGRLHGGTVTEALVSAVDLFPTVLEMAGVPQPEAGSILPNSPDWVAVEQPSGVQGRSMRPLLAGETQEHRDWAYVECDASELGDRLRHVRSRDWALTYYTVSGEGTFFDLRNDPGELYNRWNDPGYAGAKSEALQALLRETVGADDWLPPRKAIA